MSDVRLIDANRFKRFLQALCKAGAPYDDVIQLLDKEPTAHNPEKVVEELKERSNDAVSNIFAYEEDDHIGIYNDGLADGYEHAIDIVKRGGVK